MTPIDKEREGSTLRFHDALLAKLNEPRCVAKTDWRGMTPREILDCLEAELVEARHEIGFDGNARQARRRQLQGEAVDIAAFAFMLWDLIEVGSR